jgi:hypothetical protein
MKGMIMRAALIALVLSAAPVLAADADKDYFPMKIGSKWTFKIEGQEDRFVWTAAKTAKVGDQDCVVFEAKLKDQVVGSEYVAILKDGIYRFKLSDGVITPPVCFFKSTIKKGETWNQDFKVNDIVTNAKYTMDIEDVKVPAGEYKDAILIKTDGVVTKPESAGKKDSTVSVKSSIWYVKNVGIVKQSFEIDDSKYSLVLEKMEEATDPKK